MITFASPPEWVTVAQAATFLGVSHQTVRRRIDEGLLAAYRVGGKGSPIRIDRRDLYTYLRQMRSGL